MENITFSTIVDLLQLAIVPSFLAWLVYKNRKHESDNSLEATKVSNADDMIAAYGNLQAQLAVAAENMVKPLNLQISNLQQRVAQVENENVILRAELEKERSDKSKIASDLVLTNKQVDSLRQELNKALENEKRLRARLNKIRKDIDTGELSSGVLQVPSDKSENKK